MSTEMRCSGREYTVRASARPLSSTLRMPASVSACRTRLDSNPSNALHRQQFRACDRRRFLTDSGAASSSMRGARLVARFWAVSRRTTSSQSTSAGGGDVTGGPVRYVRANCDR